MGGMMDAYNAKIKLVLDKIIDESPDQSALFPTEDETMNKLRPFFSSVSLFKQLCEAMKCRLLDCGWKDEIKLECSKAIQRRGLDNINIDEVVSAVTPIARSTIPIEVKKNIVALLQDALTKELQQMDNQP